MARGRSSLCGYCVTNRSSRMIAVSPAGALYVASATSPVDVTGVVGRRALEVSCCDAPVDGATPVTASNRASNEPSLGRIMSAT